MDVIAVDWSGAALSPSLAYGRARDGRLLEIGTSPSREALVERLIEFATSASTSTSPSLDAPLVVGLDFAFSMPCWLLEERGLNTARELWQLADREGEEWLHACEPPFWGRPGKPRPEVIEHFRRTEKSLRVAGISPKSVFQVGGAGAVGTGSIRGMPFLARLQDAGFAIWPFDELHLPLVVEIWPRVLTGPVVKSNPVARLRFLEAVIGGQIGEAVTIAAAGMSEDLFDAAVSAVVMSEHGDELVSLPVVEDPVVRLEGEIWAPGWRLRPHFQGASQTDGGVYPTPMGDTSLSSWSSPSSLPSA